MRRFTIYFLIALITFTIGSFIALNIYWKSKDNSPKNYIAQNNSQNAEQKKPWEKPWINTVSASEKKETPTKPFCNNPKISKIWNFLQNDRDFKEWNPITADSLNCEELLEIKEIDLNRDGKTEIFLSGKNNLCSAVGNCAFWIFAKDKKGYKKLLYATDYNELEKFGTQIKNSKTNGFPDILLKGHLTASDTSYETYKFDGKKYKQSKCLVETPIVAVSENPKWEFVGCKQFFKRWEDEK
ncbi:MAG TPA: hypothetical protein PKY59_03880 [Pyrinomonadaceae bacterium]|nr:hypothetical protein [Pyrinomonadaceae bacterium]